jgi:hypothetical protein
MGSKLIWSPDGGNNWCNQDGSSPVVWESWEARSRATMVFFEETQDAFSLLTLLQMGRGYEHNRDGSVYVYSPNGSGDGTMNELVMFRVPRRHVRDRRAYEFFAGFAAVAAPVGRWISTSARPCARLLAAGSIGQSIRTPGTRAWPTLRRSICT